MAAPFIDKIQYTYIQVKGDSMSMHHASPLGKFRGAVVIICLVLILGILGYAYLSDRHTTVLDKDEILNKIETA